MKKLFLFQDNLDSAYYQHLQCAFDNSQKQDRSNKINLCDLSVDFLENNNIEVIISNGLPREWYLISKGMKIVTITIDSLERFVEFADIIIDYQSKNSNKYFTGDEYAICDNPDKLVEVNEIFNLITMFEWDSEFFGFPVAYISSRHLTENVYFQIKKFIKKNKIRLVEYLCNCHDNESVRIAEQNGFHFTDIRLSFEKKLFEDRPITLQAPIIFGRAEQKHIPELRELCHNLYRDSRYYFDGNFAIEKIHEFYKNWIEKAVHGTLDDESYCLFADNSPIGFCTIRYNPANTASIGLFGLSKLYHGKGLAQKLLHLVDNNLIEKNIKKLYVVTQGRNYSAQRLYQRSGFITKATELWYHKWI